MFHFLVISIENNVEIEQNNVDPYIFGIDLGIYLGFLEIGQERDAGRTYGRPCAIYLEHTINDNLKGCFKKCSWIAKSILLVLLVRKMRK